MKPNHGLILLALIILVFGTVPAINAQMSTTTFENPKEVFCNNPPVSGEIYSPAQNPAQVDYYKISLLSGQKLIIDVDAETIGSTLDAFLEVFELDATPVDANNDQINDPNDPTDDSLDPYLEITASSNDVTYIIAISSGSENPTDPLDSSNTGSYTVSLQCADQSSSSEVKWPVAVGDLLGATGSETGSLVNINPENGESSLPFPLNTGPITDIEFDPGNKLVFVAVDAVDYLPAKIIAIDPTSGSQFESYSLETASVVALEAAENKLYGVRIDSSGVNFTLVEVTFDSTTKTAKLTDVVSLGRTVVRALAYNQSDKIMYGASGVDLLKINLASLPVQVQTVTLTGLLSEISALDFSDNDVLYGVDRLGNLFNVPDLSSAQAEPIGKPMVGVKSLTFVVGETPPDVEPVKTLCSSTLISATTASSETDVPKLSILKLKNNPLHRAIGLFKFQGKAGEEVTLRLAPDGEEAAVAGEESSIKTLFKSWLQCNGQGRVFLGIRDAIPNVDFRVRKKDQMPFDMSAELPEDGYYYVMVIRPLLRFYQTDYCLTLESKHPESVAWQTLDVVWPGDNAEEDTAATSTEAKTAEALSDEVFIEESSVLEDTTSGEITGVVPTLTGSEPVGLAPDSSTPGPLDQVSSQEVQAVEETTVDETAEVAPAEEPATEVTVEPTVMGAPPILEETTVDETGVVAPEKSADEIYGQDESADVSGSAEVVDDDGDGTKSTDVDTSELVEEESTEASAP